METFKYKNQKVKLTETDSQPEVYIGDEKVPVLEVKDGYTIFYSRGKTLKEAVKAYIDTQSNNAK